MAKNRLKISLYYLVRIDEIGALQKVNSIVIPNISPTKIKMRNLFLIHTKDPEEPFCPWQKGV